MINAVAQFANRDHSESEMVVVAIMSHGGKGGFIQVKSIFQSGQKCKRGR
jgi:hypothetical protein